MIKSMTGFGRYEAVTEERKITVEMKSVNHRYCDISIRLPKKLNFLEATIRNTIKKSLNRGKIDVFITYEDYTKGSASVKYNKEMAAEYLKYLNLISEELGVKNEVTNYNISRYPEVFSLEEQSLDENALLEFVLDAVDNCCKNITKTREAEGENLKKDILDKLDFVYNNTTKIEEKSPLLVSAYREKLYAKVKEILEDTKLDEAILATEITMYADKICVDEETVRLKSHVDSMRKTLDMKESIGRKLDFISQEMNREANTILSKADDMEITNMAIDLKTEIEKIREQIQNIE
jgi:uncharacterized protein (TIGR00255 family)